MSKIRVRNFGPIKNGNESNDGWIDIKKVTVFIGNQGSGKSTVAKLISTFTWIEKALVRGDYDLRWFKEKDKLKNQFLNYHRLENYFKNYNDLFDKTEIEYEGEAYNIKYSNGELVIKENPNRKYYLPQIMYVPAERNFIAYVRTPRELKLSSDSLQEFLTEYNNAKRKIGKSLKLPINDIKVKYDSHQDSVNIFGGDYNLNISEASSGFQSLVPLYLVSWYLSNSVAEQANNSDDINKMNSKESERFGEMFSEIINNPNFTDEQRRIAVSKLTARFNKNAFINIVEEPEQNLFPTSQWKMLTSLLEMNNKNLGNKLIMTTHSPYIVNYLSLVVQASQVNEVINERKSSEKLEKRLNQIISNKALTSGKDIVIYQLSDSEGTIKELPTFEGIPSDSNFLNEILMKGNNLFDQLLEIEEEL